VTALPYPHARNDCVMCRERDADLHVLGEKYNQPGKRPFLVCQGCIGKHLALRAIQEGGPELDQPVVLTVTVAPGRRAVRPGHVERAVRGGPQPRNLITCPG